MAGRPARELVHVCILRATVFAGMYGDIPVFAFCVPGGAKYALIIKLLSPATKRGIMIGGNHPVHRRFCVVRRIFIKKRFAFWIIDLACLHENSNKGVLPHKL